MERQGGNRAVMTRQDWSLRQKKEKDGWAKAEIFKSGRRRRAPLWFGYASRMKHHWSLTALCLQPSAQRSKWGLCFRFKKT